MKISSIFAPLFMNHRVYAFIRQLVVFMNYYDYNSNNHSIAVHISVIILLLTVSSERLHLVDCRCSLLLNSPTNNPKVKIILFLSSVRFTVNVSLVSFTSSSCGKNRLHRLKMVAVSGHFLISKEQYALHG